MLVSFLAFVGGVVVLLVCFGLLMLTAEAIVAKLSWPLKAKIEALDKRIKALEEELRPAKVAEMGAPYQYNPAAKAEQYYGSGTVTCNSQPNCS